LSYEGNQIDFGSPSYVATSGESNKASFTVRDTFGMSKTSKWITESAVDGLAFLSLVGQSVYPLAGQYPIHFDPSLAGLEVPEMALDEFSYLLLLNDKNK